MREAAREADDAATALIAALQRDAILSDAQGAAGRSLKLANAIYREGYSDFQRVLDAQRALFAQQDAYIVNRSNAVGSLIALYKALGGGWYSKQPLVEPATRRQMQQRTDWGDLLNEPEAASGHRQPVRGFVPMSDKPEPIAAAPPKPAGACRRPVAQSDEGGRLSDRRQPDLVSARRSLHPLYATGARAGLRRRCLPRKHRGG